MCAAVIACRPICSIWSITAAAAAAFKPPLGPSVEFVGVQVGLASAHVYPTLCSTCVLTDMSLSPALVALWPAILRFAAAWRP